MGIKTNIGTLYGVGVGPGEPDLITLKAINILKKVDMIFAASSSANEHSIALSIVERFVENKEVIPLSFPMTSDKETLKRAWGENAMQVITELKNGKDVAFITLGDPLTYSTFIHLMRTIKEFDPHITIVAVPGITSYNAAAARFNVPIAQAKQGFYVISGVDGGGESLKTALSSNNTVFILKSYKKFNKILNIIKTAGRLQDAIMISNLGLEDERSITDLSSLKSNADITPSYLSLIIVKPKSYAAEEDKSRF